MTKLTVAFRNFANAPKNETNLCEVSESRSGVAEKSSLPRREDTAFSTGKWELGLLGQKTEKALRSF